MRVSDAAQPVLQSQLRSKSERPVTSAGLSQAMLDSCGAHARVLQNAVRESFNQAGTAGDSGCKF